MPRIARYKNYTPQGVYHVMSKITLSDYFDAYEKDYFLKLLKKLSQIYYTQIYGYAVMDNHFHLLLQMQPKLKEESISDFKKRYDLYQQQHKFPHYRSIDNSDNIPLLKEKWCDLSEFIKDLKVSFTRWYNRRHNRTGFLWGGRFKSTLLEKGMPLLNCLAYIDLNPVRAGICNIPEDYRWNSLYYHVVKKNKDHWLSMEYIHKGAEGNYISQLRSPGQKLRYYREILYTKGKLGFKMAQGEYVKTKHKISKKSYTRAKAKNFEYDFQERFLHRCRYFTDSVILGSIDFVKEHHALYKHKLFDKRERKFSEVESFQFHSMKRVRDGTAG